MTDNLYKIERKILYKELEPLFAALSSVRYAVVKGEVLSQQIYGVPDRRRSSDIDILIDKNNVAFLENELRKLGFTQKISKDCDNIRQNRILCMMYSHQIPSYYKEKYGFELNVDINFDIYWGEYEEFRYPVEEFLTNLEDMEIYGVKVKTLSICKAFIQLVLHHYKEMNSLYHLSQHNTIRTDMFRDIYDMIIYCREILNIELIKEICVNYNIGKYVYYILYYTYQTFLDEVLLDYLQELEIYKNEELLSCYGLSLKEKKKWTVLFYERLDNPNLVEIIDQNLSENDRVKLKMQRRLFL